MALYTREIRVGDVVIGHGAPVSIQSMTNTDSADCEATLAQTRALAAAGCQIVRLSVNTADAVPTIVCLRTHTDIPLIADIHFDYRLAIASAEAGIHKLRINPGNIGEQWKVRELVACAKERGIPIRIGVNGGSLEKDILHKHGGTTPEALCESAMGHIRILEDLNFDQIAVALKHSAVPVMVASYRMLSKQVDYPLHLGVTEAGTERMGRIKSAVGIGSLLLDGIGDTIRVSLAGDPVKEVSAARDILRAVGLWNEGVDIIACPTCGRCGIDVEAIALELERRVAHIKSPIKAAVMGCVVNGPGEAREADLGIAGAGGQALFFRHGQQVSRVEGAAALELLVEEIEKLDEERRTTA